MSKEHKLINKIEEHLLSTKKFKQSWLWILFITILYFALFGIFIGFRYWHHTNYIKDFFQLNHSYVIGSEVVSYMSLVLLVGPYLFLAGCWISGLNNTSRSKYFHLVLWIFYAFVFIFIFIGLILIFRAGFFV